MSAIPLCFYPSDSYLKPKALSKREFEEKTYILQSIVCYTGRHYEIYCRQPYERLRNEKRDLFMCISDTHVRHGLKYIEVVEDCMGAFSWPVLLLYALNEDGVKYEHPLNDSEVRSLQYKLNEAQFELKA